MPLSAPRTFDWKRLAFMLAAVAVVLKVLFPPGFMLASAREAGSFPLVICTAQGPVVADAGHPADPESGGDDQPSADHPCPFTSTAAAPAPDLANWTLVAFALRGSAGPQPSLTHLAPGRGLAAPPPARAPPSLLI